MLKIPQNFGVKFAVLLACFALNLSYTILSVALPDIGHSLSISETDISWIPVAPGLVSAMTMPFCGALSDRFGSWRIWMLGVAANIIATVSGALSVNFTMLMLSRLVTGLAVAMNNPSGMSLLVQCYPREKRSIPAAHWTLNVTLSSALGLVVGGLLAKYFSWRMIFWMQLPWGVLAMVVGFISYKRNEPVTPSSTAAAAAAATSPSSPTSPTSVTQRRPVDALGTITLGSSAFCALVAVNQGPVRGWSSLFVMLVGGGFVVFLIAFVVVENKKALPMLPKEAMRDKILILSIMTSFLLNFCYMGAFIIMPFLFQNIYEISAEKISGVMAIRPGSMVVAAALIHKLKDSPLLVVLGAAFIVISLTMYTIATPDTSIYIFIIALTIQGAGLGFAGTLLTAIISLRAPPSLLGTLLGVLSMLNTVANSSGMMTFLSLVATFGGINAHEAYRAAFGIGIVICLIPLLFAVFIVWWLKREEKKTAQDGDSIQESSIEMIDAKTMDVCNDIDNNDLHEEEEEDDDDDEKAMVGTAKLLK